MKLSTTSLALLCSLGCCVTDAQYIQPKVRLDRTLLGSMHASLQESQSIFHDGRTSKMVEVPGDPKLAHYAIRLTNPEICDPGVKQISGYFDVGNGKNLFFWFFEARNSPETAPFILWQNGGPGGSSLMGLLEEQIGPCTVIENGTDVKYNSYSWNTFSNIMFLDQPSDVGYSYLAEPPTRANYVVSAQQAGEDVWGFLQLFFGAFPQYADLPFHSAGESYGGKYVPWVAHAIHEHNKAIAHDPWSGRTHINLNSILLGNAAVNPRVQGPKSIDWFCEGPYKEKFGLNSTTPLYSRCEQTGLPVHCFLPLQCEANAYEGISTGSWNPYNVVLPCATAESVTCYKESLWTNAYLDRTDVKLALGVDPDRPYVGINFDVNTAFMLDGDMGKNSAVVLPALLNDGIRVLNYAGKADSVCDYIVCSHFGRFVLRWLTRLQGNLAWMEELDDHPFVDEFRSKQNTAWYTKDGQLAGDVRSAGNGSYTYVAINDAGHMMPMEHGDWAMDLVYRWIHNEPLQV
ncbi:Alpha/Beta hydrolase protein [Auriculariales sp. MPI-PUGE-AT-0066]|nr:Alpha/Beta hydrolase protein [Auriculariales sp. MPI-PUGE-AT-0066]